MSERQSEPQKPKPSYSEFFQLNKELVHNLEGLAQEHEARKRELDELRFAQDQAQAEITRLQEELRHAQTRDAERHEQLRQLEQERVDQLMAMGAHLDALRAALDRYLHEGRKAA